MDERGLTFGRKDYRAKDKTRHKTMALKANEFMRRFLLHVPPSGSHRFRHYGLLANGAHKGKLALARELMHVAPVANVPNGRGGSLRRRRQHHGLQHDLDGSVLEGVQAFIDKRPPNWAPPR